MTPVRTYYVGEQINNLGCKILLSEDDNTTQVTYSISNGVLNTNSSYVNDFTVAMSGINQQTLTNGQILVDNSINKIGNNYNIVFAAPNTTQDLVSSNIILLEKLMFQILMVMIQIQDLLPERIFLIFNYVYWMLMTI